MASAVDKHLDYLLDKLWRRRSLFNPPAKSWYQDIVIKTIVFDKYVKRGLYKGRVTYNGRTFFTKPMKEPTMGAIKVLQALVRGSKDDT